MDLTDFTDFFYAAFMLRHFIEIFIFFFKRSTTLLTWSHHNIMLWTSSMKMLKICIPSRIFSKKHTISKFWWIRYSFIFIWDGASLNFFKIATGGRFPDQVRQRTFKWLECVSQWKWPFRGYHSFINMNIFI